MLGGQPNPGKQLCLHYNCTTVGGTSDSSRFGLKDLSLDDTVGA